MADTDPRPGEAYWDYVLRMERAGFYRPKPQQLEQPIPPQYGPCGEGLEDDYRPRMTPSDTDRV